MLRRTRRSNNVLLIGPSGAGKTSLLGAVCLASNLNPYREGHPACRLTDLNEHMQGIADTAAESFRTGRLPINATTETTSYEFTIRFNNHGFFKQIVEGSYDTVQLTLLDSPGGVLLPQAGATENPAAERTAEQLIRQALDSDVLIVCVDSADESQPLTFFVSLNALLQRIGKPLPFREVLVLLTKAECLIEDEQRARRTNPWYRAWQLLTETVVHTLWDYANPATTRLASGWVSANGFVPGLGVPNYDTDEDRLSTFRETLSPQEVAAHWHPFQILDPFVYAAGGGTQTLWIHRGFRPIGTQERTRTSRPHAKAG